MHSIRRPRGPTGTQHGDESGCGVQRARSNASPGRGLAQLVCMSASLPNARELAAWLGYAVVHEAKLRPTPLTQRIVTLQGRVCDSAGARATPWVGRPPTPARRPRLVGPCAAQAEERHKLRGRQREKRAIARNAGEQARSVALSQ